LERVEQEVGCWGVGDWVRERGIWVGNSWWRRVNCIYYLGDGTWIFENDNVNVIYLGWSIWILAVEMVVDKWGSGRDLLGDWAVEKCAGFGWRS
jgi:hypothetical protein